MSSRFDKPFFSLLVGTIGRIDTMERFLRHLAAQTCRDLEVIVVDQNSDDRLVSLLTQYAERFPIQHLRCSPGLSKARNVGLPHCSGLAVGFPDDDCWYEPDFLDRLRAMFIEHSDWDGITCLPFDDENASAYHRMSSFSQPVRKHNIWRTGGISYAIFLRDDVVRTVGGFDEQLGVGTQSPWKSGEETDYLLRAIEMGAHIEYLPDLRVFHRAVPLTETVARDRAYGYSLGFGHVLRKHRFPLWFVAYMCSRPVAAAILAAAKLDRLRTRYYCNVARGRVAGWMG